ncbi:MAG TPA: peptidylprolyl isomerase [Gemmatimonadaceae bacterium]
MRTAFIVFSCLGAALACERPAEQATNLPVNDSLPPFGEIIGGAPPEAWQALDPENTLYLDLPRGRVIIRLAEDWAPSTVANIKALVRRQYFDGASIIRSQDNYVVQWGWPRGQTPPFEEARRQIGPEFDIAIPPGVPFTALPDPDTYAPEVGFSNGWPVARDPSIGRAWLTHCYAMVGVARGDAPNSGSGAELYVVIGHAPRHLDRNIAVVGRVVQGMELLSTMPRGTGNQGFYETAAERTRIRSVRVAADVPEAERVPLEFLRTDSDAFKQVIVARRSRREVWFVEPSDRINLCNVPLPVRMALSRTESESR